MNVKNNKERHHTSLGTVILLSMAEMNTFISLKVPYSIAIKICIQVCPKYFHFFIQLTHFIQRSAIR